MTTSSPAAPTATPAGLLDRLSAPFLGQELHEVVVEPPDGGPGSWAGAPSALLVDGTYYLAYRLRRPIGAGRGFANVVAASADGVRFTTLAVLERDRFDADSLERPALAVTAGGRWRVYVSAATPGTRHWRVDVVEADSPAGLGSAPHRTVLAGGPGLAVKDPVVLRDGDRWQLWASCHPLDDPDQTDRMTTDYAVSTDGLEWQWQGTALAGRPGSWDARGVRAAAVLPGPAGYVVYYDGRATAEENWEERTGVATGAGPTGLVPLGDRPVGESPDGAGGLRYVSVVPDPAGGARFYYERTRPDGAHELATTYQPDFALTTT